MWMEFRLELYETAYSNCVEDLEIQDLAVSDLVEYLSVEESLNGLEDTDGYSLRV